MNQHHANKVRVGAWKPIITTACYVCIGMSMLSALAWAQVERPTPSSTNAPPATGMAGGRAQQAVTPPDLATAADPRNFTGLWKVDNTATATGGMAAGAAVGGGMAAAPNAAASTRRTGKSTGLMCIPDKNIFGGGDGGLEIIQTANQLTLVAEENHRIRRIYLNAEHPKTITPSYAGHSVGHWEGNVLVVDTVGMRNGGATVDRMRKIDNGAAIEIQTQSKGETASRTMVLRWNAKPIAEWICEDYTDEFFSDDYK